MQNKIVGSILFTGSLFFIFSCSMKEEKNEPLCMDTMFVSAIWKNSETQRERMINDLVKNKRLIHMTRDSVIDLLGTPSEESSFFMNYLYDMNCGKQKYGLMLFHLELDSTSKLVKACFLTD